MLIVSFVLFAEHSSSSLETYTHLFVLPTFFPAITPAPLKEKLWGQLEQVKFECPSFPSPSQQQ